MIKVKYTPPIDSITYKRLTINKVYDVISYNHRSITLLGDNGIIDLFHLYSDTGMPRFTDATAELRNEIIDDILK